MPEIASPTPPPGAEIAISAPLDPPAAPPKTEERKNPEPAKDPPKDPEPPKAEEKPTDSRVEFDPISKHELFSDLKKEEQVESPETPEKEEAERESKAKEEEEREKKSEQNKGLRESLAEANAAREKAERAMADAQKREEAARSELEAFKAEQQQRAEQQQDQAALFNPSTHPEAVAIEEAYQNRVDNFISSKELTMGRAKARQLKGQLKEIMSELNRVNSIEDDEAHAKAGQSLRDVLEEAYGAEADEVLSLAQDGVKNYAIWNEKVKDLEGRAAELIYERNQGAYREALTVQRTVEENWFNLNDEWADQNPDHPFSIIHAYRKDYPDVFEAKRKETTERGRRLFLPDTPMSPADLAAMSPEDRKKLSSQRSAAKAMALSEEANLYGYYRDALEVVKLQQAEIAELRKGQDRMVDENPTPKRGDQEEPKAQESKREESLTPISAEEIWRGGAPQA